MVVLYSSEKPNLSYVRINQNTSDGTGPSIKTYITKGLVSSDPFVVNASLLHTSLVAQPTVLTGVESPHWGTLDLPIDSQDGPKEFPKSGGTVSVDYRSDAMPAACAATSPGATPEEIASARPKFKQPLTSVRLPEGAILVKINSQQPPTNPLTIPYSMPPTPPSSSPSSPPSSPPPSPPSSSPPSPPSSSPPSPPSSPPPSPPSTRPAKGIKRKLDEVDCVNYPQIAKISNQTCTPMIVKSRLELIQENQHLERTNKILVDENRELRDKLDLLSKILKDPRKRDMLTARLARMQTAAS